MIASWSAGSLLLLYFAGQRAAVNMLLFLSTALFLNRAGVDKLPIIYIMINCLSIGIQMWTSAHPKMSSYSQLRRVSRAMIAVTALAPVALYGGGTGWLAVSTVFGLQICVRVFEILSGTLFLNIVNEIYPLREAKERIPKLLSVASASIVIAGLIVKPVTGLLTVEGTILATACLLSFDQMVLGHIGGVLRRARGRSTSASAAEAASPEDQAAQLVAEDVAGQEREQGPRPARPHDESGAHLRGGKPAEEGSGKHERSAPAGPDTPFSMLKNSPLVSAMVSVALLVSFLKFLQDFQYSAALARHFRDQAQLATFLGYYEAAITVLIIAAQTALTGPAIRRFKLGVVVSLLPAVMAVTCVCGALMPTLGFIIAGKVVYTVLSNAFYNPAGSLLVGPLTKAARDRARMWVSTATSGGCLIVGIALQVGLKSVSAGTCFAVMGFFYLVALLLARRLDAGYLRELSVQLADTDVNRRLESVRALRVVSQTYAADRILELLNDPDPEVRERAVREVKFLGPLPARRVLDRVLEGGGDPRVRASALREAVGVLGDGALDFAEGQLADKDRRVQANALEAIAAVGNDGAIRTLISYVDHADHRLRAIAAVGLVRSSSNEAHLELGLATLAKMARSPDVLTRATAAVAMGDLAFPFFVNALVTLAGDPVEQVSERALEALEELRAPEAAPALSRLARRPELAGRLARLQRARERIEDRGSQDLLQVMETLSGEERARLKEHLRDVKHAVRAQVLGRALSLANPRARQAVVTYLHRATHAGAPALVAECLTEDPPTIAPALDAMRSGHYRGEEAISALLVGFMTEANAALLRAYLREVWDRVRATMQLAGRWAPGTPEADENARRRARLLAHGFALVGLLSRKPRQVVESLEKALEGDKFVASISMELVSVRIGREADADLVPLIEDLRAPETWSTRGKHAVSDELVEIEAQRLRDYLEMLAKGAVVEEAATEETAEEGWEAARG